MLTFRPFPNGAMRREGHQSVYNSMKDALTISTYRIDDIPLLWAVLEDMQLARFLDGHLVQHGNSRRDTPLSVGQTIVVWLVYVLTESSHCKSTVASWVDCRKELLTRLLGVPVSGDAFSDDRLTTVLRRLHDQASWESIEADLCARELSVYSLDGPVFLDTTTTCGYHDIHENGLIRFGHSKDHRPDLGQAKLMSAVTAKLILATNVAPGNTPDEPLYAPMLRRVHSMLGAGHLYVGDCKMSVPATRAWCSSHGDWYLSPLSRNLEASESLDKWIARATEATSDLSGLKLIVRDGEILGGGYEFIRSCAATVDGQEHTWNERVMVIRSSDMANRMWAGLVERLALAESALAKLTPPKKSGQRQPHDADALQKAIDSILERCNVKELLTVTFREELYKHTNGTQASRFVIISVSRNQDRIDQLRWRQGWRMLATNLEGDQAGLPEAVMLYRGMWSIERQFHVLKDRPIGIRPLFVRLDDQIIGLTHLLSLATRALEHFEGRVRESLADAGESIGGLYAHDPKKTTASPTATRILKAICRQEITLVSASIGEQSTSKFSPLPQWLERLLKCAHLPEDTYTRLLSCVWPATQSTISQVRSEIVET
jgi:transposase